MLTSILSFLSSSPAELVVFLEATFIVSILVSALISSLMIRARPKTKLEFALLLRELAAIVFFSRLLITVVFEQPLQIWALLAYSALVFSSIFVAYEVIKLYAPE